MLIVQDKAKHEDENENENENEHERYDPLDNFH